MNSYDTVTEAVSDLVKRGYTENFSTGKTPIQGIAEIGSLSPDDFRIDEVFRFEGETDPADETIVYAISSLHTSRKGILINAYGPYSDSLSNELVEKLKLH